MQKVNNVIPRKLCRLSSFLHHASNEFDNIAQQIKEKKTRMSIRSVSMKVKQYGQELDSQIGMLNMRRPVNTNNNREKANKLIEHENISDKKIVELCSNSEVFFSKAYKSILNEHLPFKPLKDMLRYQLTGIRTVFRQLKLLSSVMPTAEEIAVI